MNIHSSLYHEQHSIMIKILLSVGEMYPAHPNVDAIRTQLNETGDLLGFLSTLRNKLTLQNL